MIAYAQFSSVNTRVDLVIHIYYVYVTTIFYLYVIYMYIDTHLYISHINYMS